jgi:NAD(P) transhydrogenase subunit alpha
LSKDQHQLELDLIQSRLGNTDVVISTAAIPGKRAPILLTKSMVEVMKPGSVIVDLAAETGGNCELTKPGETVVHHSVIILGPLDIASTLATHASQMYSRNIVALLLHLSKDGQPNLDFNDEITRGSCLTHGGRRASELQLAEVKS